MKLFLETEAGLKVEIKEINKADSNAELLIFFLDARWGPDDLDRVQKNLGIITGRECLVLGKEFRPTIYGI